MIERILSSSRVAFATAVVVAVLLGIRAVLWSIGIEGMSVSPLASSIVAGGVFVMGLVVAGTLSDYKDAERAKTDLASGPYPILRECESMHAVWGLPSLHHLRQRLITVVVTLRSDINSGNTRECQEMAVAEEHAAVVEEEQAALDDSGAEEDPVVPGRTP